MLSFPQIQIDTSRLVLRPLRADDADALFAVFSDAEVMRFWNSPPWSTVEAARSSISEDRYGSDQNYLRLGIQRKHDANIVGTCTFFALNEGCRRAELGYALRSDLWGHGYMPEALRAMIAYGFDELNLNRVEADIDPRNLASAKTLERLGFKCEGLLRERWIVNGELSDSSFFGLLRGDWFARSTASDA